MPRSGIACHTLPTGAAPHPPFGGRFGRPLRSPAMTLPPGVDPRSPVIVGVAQLLDSDGGREPVDLAAEAVRLAADDAQAPGLVEKIDTIAVVPIVSWRYFDAGAVVGERLGVTPKERWYPSMGGNTPQMLVSRAAREIAEGRSDVVAVCGAESFRTRQTMRRAGETPPWTKQPDTAAPTWGEPGKLDMGHPSEMAKGLIMPTACYPLFENALRHEAGRTAAEHTAAIAELWAGFSEVASRNPYAVDRTAYSAEEIATVTESNRMIGFPYTKHMVSNPDLDASSAVILCSARTASDAGVPPERWVFPWSGTDGEDPYMSLRPDFVSSPAMRVAGRTALELAGRSVDQIEHLDVYSCFPSAVEIACAELGIPLDRQLTVYGGLCFAGGPWNNPVGHALATMVGVLRDDPGSVGLVTANGGIIQKHAFGVYSTTPPAEGFRYARPQDEIDAATELRTLVDPYEGPAEVETWTVMYERDGSFAGAHAALLTPDGDRCWGLSKDADLMARMVVEDLVGAPATVAADGTMSLV